MRCATHPDVETELRCGRCGIPICPRCLVQTPVGARCRSCARLRRLPMYDISVGVALRAVAAALALGAALGVVWGLLLPAGPGFGLFGALFGLLLGSPLGYFFADVLDRVTNRKRGPLVQSIAVAGLGTAWVAHAVLAGGVVVGDWFGVTLVVAAAVAAVGRLR